MSLLLSYGSRQQHMSKVLQVADDGMHTKCSVVAQEQGSAKRSEHERENEAQERVQGRSHAAGADVVVVASLPLAACHRFMPIACGQHRGSWHVYHLQGTGHRTGGQHRRRAEAVSERGRQPLPEYAR
jgi:hypothetical protein